MNRGGYRSDQAALAKLLLALALILIVDPLAAAQDGQPAEGPALDVPEAEQQPASPADEPAHEADQTPHPDGVVAANTELEPAETSSAFRPSPRALAFTKRLKEVIEHELTVQKYEQESLGAIPIATIRGQRLQFRLRVDGDAEHFMERLASVPMAPLELPRIPLAQRALSLREKLLIGRINRAYIKDRDTAILDFIMNTNKKFLATENWSARAGVVHSRDALLSREIAYSDLAAAGRKMLVTEPNVNELDDIEAILDEISPETKTAEKSIVQELLTDKDLQAQVLGQLSQVLTSRYDPQIPPESDEELLETLEGLQKQLLNAAGLTETRKKLAALDAEIAVINRQLDDMGVAALTLDQRRATAKRKSKLMVERNSLQLSWNQTAPPEPQATQLIKLQDSLIRRRLHDLGAQGALFAHRYDELDPARMLAAGAHPSPPETWRFFDAQAQLITHLDEARPAPNPLAGLSFGPIAPASLGLPQGLLGKLPKPKKGKKGPGKKKKGKRR